LAHPGDCKDGFVKSKYRKDSNLLPLIAKMDSFGDPLKM
jgi:hypothetical protein